MDDMYARHREHGLSAFKAVLAVWGLTYEALNGEALVVPAEGPYPLVITTIEVTDERTTLDTIYPFMAPAQRRSRTLELAARLNSQVDVGALTTDPDDGELGFRTCLPIRAKQITVAIAAEALEQHWAAANRTLPGLAAVVFTDLSLSAAIAQNEGTTPIDEVVRSAIRRLDVD